MKIYAELTPGVAGKLKFLPAKSIRKVQGKTIRDGQIIFAGYNSKAVT